MHLNGCLADSVSTPTWIYGIPSSSTGSLIVLTGSSRLSPSTPQTHTPFPSPCPAAPSFPRLLLRFSLLFLRRERARSRLLSFPREEMGIGWEKSRGSGEAREGGRGEKSFYHSTCARFFRTGGSFVVPLDTPRVGNLIDILPPARLLSDYPHCSRRTINSGVLMRHVKMLIKYI